MKKLVLIGLAFIFFILIVGLIAYKLLVPAQAPKTALPAIQFPQVKSGVDAQTLQKINSELITQSPDTPNIQMVRVVEDSNYLLGDWADKNIGGMVVFKRDISHWSILLMDGGVLTKAVIEQAGVPADVTERLFAKYQAL